MFATIRPRNVCLFLCKNRKIEIPHKTVILPFVEKGCETWPHILRQEHKFKEFWNEMNLGRFGSVREEVTR